MLEKMERYTWRPAHMHFLACAAGYETITTHTFVDGDPYLETDAVSGVQESLIAVYEPNETGETSWKSNFDFVLRQH